MNTPTLIVHITGGATAILAGTAALVVRKGSRLHAKAGTIFVYAMVVMTVGGTILALLRPTRLSVLAGVLTFYLVTTSWASIRRRDGRTGALELGGLFLALGCVALGVSFALIAKNAPSGLEGLPAAAYLPFTLLALLAASLDFKMIVRRQLSTTQRLTRHVWRMSTAFLITAFSFFIGQQKIMPAVFHGSPIMFAPELAIFAVMMFWTFRIRFGNIKSASVQSTT